MATATGSMAKSRTVQMDKMEIDFMVLEYSSRDSSVLSTLGKHCKESSWTIAVGHDSVPLHIVLHVDKQVALAPEVYVMCNGDRIFPLEHNREKAKLRQDFKWSKNFRGTIKGLAAKNFFEVRPEHLSHEQWYPATLTEQREDGLFKAILQMPDGRGSVQAIDVPGVRVENVREAAGMKRPVQLPSRNVRLEVPMRDPLHALLLVDNEPVTHFFGRPTPAPEQSGQTARNRVAFNVARNRTEVSADVGHGALDHFLSGQVRSIRQDADELMHAWRFQIGPFAEHRVELQKKFRFSNLISLTIDGALLVEATAEDIESRPGYWECSFRFVGERYMDWNVYESDGHGASLATQGTVTHRSKFSHECFVCVQLDSRSLVPAKFQIDGKDFIDLPEFRNTTEDYLRCSPQALGATYGLMVPYRINEAARISPSSFLSPIGGHDGGGSLFGLFDA
eukprot:TRINITY_DN110447_c0_g1_i1.p1 TRINITY_DN110447_c0_g1~~TRINITY_DN110447_c0_g1_i1.p1  ORF type:complete len:450 (-),score=72.05 TRINITY_DN110447_c0_g1_i1:9-1358(-)